MSCFCVAFGYTCGIAPDRPGPCPRGALCLLCLLCLRARLTTHTRAPATMPHGAHAAHLPRPRHPPTSQHWSLLPLPTCATCPPMAGMSSLARLAMAGRRTRLWARFGASTVAQLPWHGVMARCARTSRIRPSTREPDTMPTATLTLTRCPICAAPTHVMPGEPFTRHADGTHAGIACTSAPAPIRVYVLT